MNAHRSTIRILLALTLAAGQAQADSVAEVPFEHLLNIPFVQVKLGDSRPLWFVLDTGSTRMLVDAKIARDLALKEEEADSVSGAGAGRVPIRKIHDISIQIGELKSAHYEFASIDLSAVSSMLGRQIDGILGYEFLSRFAVTIDYTRNQLAIREPNSPGNPPGQPIPIKLDKRWPFVEARLVVRGAQPVTEPFLIDTGSADAVDHPVIEQPSVQKSATRTGQGLGEPVAGFIGTAEELQIGPFVLRDLPIASGGATAAVSKLIGSAVLSRFTVTYDYANSRLWLAERPGSAVEQRDSAK